MSDEIDRLERRREELVAARRRLRGMLADLPRGHPKAPVIMAKIDQIDEEIRRIDSVIALLRAEAAARKRASAYSAITSGMRRAGAGDDAAADAALAEADRVLTAEAALPPEWDW